VFLARRFRTSPTTVSNAYAMLEKDGLIVRGPYRPPLIVARAEPYEPDARFIEAVTPGGAQIVLPGMLAACPPYPEGWACLSATLTILPAGAVSSRLVREGTVTTSVPSRDPQSHGLGVLVFTAAPFRTRAWSTDGLHSLLVTRGLPSVVDLGAGGPMPRSMVGLLAAAATAMSAFVGLAHDDLVWITLIDAAAATGLAAYAALPAEKKSIMVTQRVSFFRSVITLRADRACPLVWPSPSGR
jgi:hypothetical protein